MRATRGQDLVDTMVTLAAFHVSVPVGRLASASNTRRKTLLPFLRRFMADRQGATAIEYGLIAAMIAVLGLAALPLMRTQISLLFLRLQVTLDFFTAR